MAKILSVLGGPQPVKSSYYLSAAPAVDAPDAEDEDAAGEDDHLELNLDDAAIVAADWAAMLNSTGDSSAKREVNVSLSLSPPRMTVPITKQSCFVGRASDVQAVTDALAGPSARVLVWGVQGIGARNFLSW